MENSHGMSVTVIGAGGHVGLGMSLALTRAGYHVNGVDINSAVNSMIMSGKLPFKEEGGQELLDEALAAGLLEMTTDLSCVKSSKYIFVVVGTPTDHNLNPVLDNLNELIEDVSPYIRRGHCVILRSTAPPRTTDQVRRKLERNTGLTEGEDFNLVYAPERFAQGHVLEEITKIPQIIGAYDERSYELVSEFFNTFSSGMNLRLSPIEAELGKLITNMARYVSFALSNEFHLIGNLFDGVNINRVIDACNYNYPRLNIPTPGPNVGGPCLYKDGWFLIERVPFQEMFSVAFRINEGMPMQIVRQLESFDGIEKVAILGMTYKANSDDTRNSLSFKLLKQLERLGYECVTVEPNLENYSPIADISGCDAVALMTPHKEFKELGAIMEAVDNPNCVYVDIWGFWDETRHLSSRGVFGGKRQDGSFDSLTIRGGGGVVVDEEGLC